MEACEVVGRVGSPARCLQGRPPGLQTEQAWIKEDTRRLRSRFQRHGSSMARAGVLKWGPWASSSSST